jgi:hypothetical protein
MQTNRTEAPGAAPQPREIIQLPLKVVIVYESNYGIRTIHTDGRSLPRQGEPQPYWHGYSVGRWDGDTLVVQSNNFRGALTGLPGDGWLDGKGDPFTDALTLTERFRRVNFGQLQIDVTIDDPKAYTRPFTVRVEQEIVADGSEMIEFICHENQKFLKLTGREPQASEVCRRERPDRYLIAIGRTGEPVAPRIRSVRLRYRNS